MPSCLRRLAAITHIAPPQQSLPGPAIRLRPMKPVSARRAVRPCVCQRGLKIRHRLRRGDRAEQLRVVLFLNSTGTNQSSNRRYAGAEISARNVLGPSARGWPASIASPTRGARASALLKRLYEPPASLHEHAVGHRHTRPRRLHNSDATDSEALSAAPSGTLQNTSGMR